MAFICDHFAFKSLLSFDDIVVSNLEILCSLEKSSLKFKHLLSGFLSLKMGVNGHEEI